MCFHPSQNRRVSHRRFSVPKSSKIEAVKLRRVFLESYEKQSVHLTITDKDDNGYICIRCLSQKPFPVGICSMAHEQTDLFRTLVIVL